MHFETTWIGHDNWHSVVFKNGGVAQDLSSVTQIDLALKSMDGGQDYLIQSNNGTTEAIKWNRSGYNTGEARIFLGNVEGLTKGKYSAILTVYDAVHPNGLVWNGSHPFPITIEESPISSQALPPAVWERAIWIDAASYEDIEEAIEMASGKTLVVRESYALNKNITIPSDVSLSVLKGGEFTNCTIYTLTIEGPFQAGLYKVFDGPVTFGPGSVMEVYPEWWCENTYPGTTDMTEAIQTAINTLLPVKLAPGRYLVTDTLSIPYIGTFTYAGVFKGSGDGWVGEIAGGSLKRATVIVTPATFNKTLFYIPRSRNLRFESFIVKGPGKTVEDSIAFHFHLYNCDCVMRNVTIYGWERGLVFGDPAGGQGNDSEMSFYSLWFLDIATCIYIYNSQSYNLNFYGCHFHYSTDVVHDVDSSYPGYVGNTIRMYGGSIGATRRAFTATPYGICVLVGVHYEPASTENSLIFDGGTGRTNGGQIFIMVGCEISCGGTSPSASGLIIRNYGVGPVAIIGCKIHHPHPVIDVSEGTTVALIGNFWLFEPLIYESTVPWAKIEHIDIANFYLFRNTNGLEGEVEAVELVPLSYSDRRDHFSNSLPTSGTWGAGSRVWKTSPTGGASPGWICISDGTFEDATATGGITDGSTPVITNLSSTVGFSVGSYVTVSAGFPSPSTPYKIIARTSSSLTLSVSSNSAQTGVTVTTVDPVFKEMAALSS